MEKVKKILEYTVLFTPDEEYGGFTVDVPALPGCHTQGDTLDEAKKNAREAIELYLEVLVERGYKIPADEDPNFFKAKVSISLNPKFAV